MGKILAVWSDSKKSGKSIAAYMLANQINVNKNLKVLVCCLNQKYSSLYRLFGVDNSATGLEDIINYKFFENLEEDMIFNIIPKCGEIYFLGSFRITNMYVQRNTDKYKDLFNKLKNSFDLVIIDCVSGKENTLTNIALQKADVVLKLYNQDIESIRGLNLVREEQSSYSQETVYLVSKYRNIYPRMTDLKRRFGLNRIFTLEYCETLQEMKNRDSLHLYLQRETDCNKSIEKLSRYLLVALGLTGSIMNHKDADSNDIRGFGRFFRRFRISARREKHEDTSEVKLKGVNELY